MLAESYVPVEGYNLDESRPRQSSYAPASGTQSQHALLGQRVRMQVRTTIRCSEREYHLRGAFVISLDYIDAGQEVFASHRHLPVHGYGKSDSEAIASFLEAFDHQYRELVECGLDELTPGGQKRRRLIEDVVESVQQPEG